MTNSETLDQVASDLVQKSVAEFASHGSFIARTHEALPALPNQNDEAAATGEAGRQFCSEFLIQIARVHRHEQSP
jgi:hypothetical protein